MLVVRKSNKLRADGNLVAVQRIAFRQPDKRGQSLADIPIFSIFFVYMLCHTIYGDDNFRNA